MKRKTRVWRLEKADGEGPYRCGLYKHFESDSACTPAPWEDEGLGAKWRAVSMVREKWYFGFPTLDLMKRWTGSPEARRALADDGCRLRCYEIDRDLACHGDAQSIFERGSAKIIEDRRPDYDC